MLEEIERFIRGHAASWQLDVQPQARLRAVLRSNPQNDGIVREFAAGQIGTIVFWFRPGDRKPFLISKMVGPALTERAVIECMGLQESANQALGHPLFPRIHAVAEIGGARAVFMEAVDGPNYEIQLARAVSGPERSVDALRRVATQQLEELGRAMRGLQAIRLSDAEVRWGATAASSAQRFLQLCPAASALVTSERIAAMVEMIDTMPLRRHFVLTEDYIANYMPGPRAVDQLVPDIRGLCAQWPGPVSGLRILLAFFRASPIREAYKDYGWLDALASCIAQGDRVEIIGASVRRFLDDIGLKSTPPGVIWAFVSGVFFMRACHEMEFHAGDAEGAALRNEYPALAADVNRIAGILRTDAGGSARLAVPRLDRDYLDGEFRDRDHAHFFAFPRLAVPVPIWLAAVARFQYRVKRRYAALYRAMRWIYRLPLDLFERLGRGSRPRDAGPR